jgi:hypothetical protein
MGKPIGQAALGVALSGSRGRSKGEGSLSESNAMKRDALNHSAALAFCHQRKLDETGPLLISRTISIALPKVDRRASTVSPAG